MHTPLLRCLLVASLAVVLLHLPPVADAAASARSALRTWARIHVAQWAPLPAGRPAAVPDGPTRRDAALPSELRWPDGAVVDVPERFDVLARSFDVVR